MRGARAARTVGLGLARLLVPLLLVLGVLLPPTAVAQEAPPDPPPVAGALTVFFLNVGQGDATLLMAPDGITALIDAGDTAIGPNLVRFLGDRGIDHLDWWLPSHPHADHVGAFTAVLDAGIPVAHALLSPQQYTTATWLRQLSLLYAKGVDVQTAVAGQVLPLDGAGQVTATVLNPPATLARPDDIEDNGVVLLVTYGATNLLFTGDLTTQGEAEVVARRLGTGAPFPPIDVLKVGHHGSAGSTGTPFLGFVRPRLGLIGVGEGNPYGHPTAAALGRLAAAGVEVLRTDRQGTVVLTSDGVNPVTVELAPAITLIPAGYTNQPSEPSEIAPGVPPAPSPTPSLPATGQGFDPTFYVGKGDAYNCGDFTSQAAAQAVLRADPRDPNRLDADRDGIACESNAAPKDLAPVPR